MVCVSVIGNNRNPLVQKSPDLVAGFPCAEEKLLHARQILPLAVIYPFHHLHHSANNRLFHICYWWLLWYQYS